MSVVGPAVAPGPAALIDDDLANVSPWGFEPAEYAAPVLIVHGGADRVIPSSHAHWLADRCPAPSSDSYPTTATSRSLRAAPMRSVAPCSS